MKKIAPYAITLILLAMSAAFAQRQSWEDAVLEILERQKQWNEQELAALEPLAKELLIVIAFLQLKDDPADKEKLAGFVLQRREIVKMMIPKLERLREIQEELERLHAGVSKE